MTDKEAAVVAALLVLRQRQESGGEHPDVIAIRARILEEIAQIRARIEQSDPERIARVEAMSPEERRQMVEDLRAAGDRCGWGTRV